MDGFLLKALILGLVQGLALFPGISRFASVYVVSRYLNITKRRAFELTFLLQFSIIVLKFILRSDSFGVGGIEVPDLK